MRPSDYPVDLDYLKRCWEQYMRAGVLDSAENESGREIDPLVLASWRRCRARLDPHSMALPVRQAKTALQTLLAQQADIITLALPHLEDICDFAAGQHLIAFLADRAGCLLAVEAHNQGRAFADSCGLRVGHYWAEDQAGTNAIALALTNAMPVQIVGPEHYVHRLHDLVTAAAPFHDIHGRVAGLIGIACPATYLSARDLPLVMATSRAVSNQLQTESLVDETLQQLTQVNTILGAVTEGVIMWDEEGRIHHCNRQAAKMFGTDTAQLLGALWNDKLIWPEELRLAVRANADVVRAESTVQLDNRRVTSLVTLRAIKGGKEQPLGYVALFRPIQQIRQLIHEQVGTEATFRLEDLASQSPPLQRVLRQAHIAARASIPVLLIGESGVGKTYLAQAIHNGGPRANRPFLSINCRAIPHELMTAELLGIERGDSRAGRPSKFELADGGTLMLNQLHYLTLELQTALLEVIDRRQLMRLGGTRPITLNVRIIATLPPNADDLVADGTIIPELYYRFGVFRFVMPPLRQRIEDIPLLVERILDRLNGDGHTVRVADDVLTVCERYPWPGNVRELESVLERALAQSRDGVIRSEHLPENVRTSRVLLDSTPIPKPVITVDEAEREAIMRAGYACNGVVTQMALELEIGRTTLWRKMKRLNISPQQFK
ncbi:MAG: dihydroxyacetone kinase operon transcriptional regulator DhaR [Anaerolineae bacterium]|nr:dihydroxyacetone kinase operon transcriptional regulator DhaR [Anaerolineae bacterium]